MLKATGRLVCLLFPLVLFAGCVAVPSAVPAVQSDGEQAIQAESLEQPLDGNPQACLDTFDDGTDYFPHKVEVHHARQWQVSYHDSYKVITMLLNPGVDRAETYVLVQCGAPHPEEYIGVDDVYIFEIPIRRLIDGGGGITGAMEMLGLHKNLIAWRGGYRSGIEYLPNVNAQFEAGLIGDIGPYGSSWEATVEFDPDLLTAYEGVEEQESTRAVGLPYVHYEPFVEGPLGSAEQLKFIALFFNKEAEANALFESIETEYLRLRELAQAQPESPTVLIGNISPSGAFQTRADARLESILIEDAGGQRVLTDELLDFSGFHPSISLELALELGADADYWFSTAYLPPQETAADFIETNPIHAEFTALVEGRMFHRFARQEDYFRTPAIRVDELLADVIGIMHGNLLRDHDILHVKPVPGLD